MAGAMATVPDARDIAEAKVAATKPERDAARTQAPTLAKGMDASWSRPAPFLTCVIPCFNEAENLKRLLPALIEVLEQVTRQWELILVDDGSTDGTAALLADWARRPGVRALILTRNFGKEAALTAGIEAANGEAVLLMDADGQHPPALVPTLVQRWRNGSDMVYCQRADRSDEGLLKRIGTRAFYALINSTDRYRVPADAGDFRLIDRTVVDALRSLPERNRFMKGLYAWVGFRSEAVPFAPEQRTEGKSRFNLRRLFGLSITGITAFTTWPLRALSVTGGLMALAAFGYGGYLTADYLLHGHPISGWTTIVVTLLLFAGVQMIALGVVGEYIGRIFEEVKARPLYLVRRELGANPSRTT